MTHHFYIYSADINEDVVMSMSNDGKILTDFRSLDFKNKVVSYEVAEPFLTFLDKYVSQLTGARELQNFHKLFPQVPVINKMTVSNIAYAILCYENAYDVWMERYKRERMPFVERETHVKTAKLKYHERSGTKIRAFRDGWTVAGRDYYQKVLEEFQQMRKDSVFWDAVTKHWQTYLNKKRTDSYIVRTLGLMHCVDEDDGEESDTAGYGDANEFRGEIDLPDDSSDEDE